MAGLGAIGTASLAGCSGGSSDGDDTAGDGDSGPNSGEADGDANNGSTSSADVDGDDSGTGESTTSVTPARVVRRFWEAIIRADYETANGVLHPGSLNYPLDETDVAVSDQALESVEAVSYDEASDIIALAPEEEFDEAIREATGVSEYTLVHVSLTNADGITPVVEQAGELLAVWLR